MINGLGIVGWGVGGIEAEAGMLGQPVYFLTPDVVGVHLTGALREGVTATDLALTITQMLRKAKVVGKFVEFYGPGRDGLAGGGSRHDCQHGARIWRDHGLLPDRWRMRQVTSARPGEPRSIASTYENYYRAQGLFGMPKRGEIEYSPILELDLATVVPSVAGPKAAPGPDRIAQSEKRIR